MVTTEKQEPNRYDITESEAAELLEYPEVRAAYDAYGVIQHEYRRALADAVKSAPKGELPDVSELVDYYNDLLERQKKVAVQLAVKYL